MQPPVTPQHDTSTPRECAEDAHGSGVLHRWFVQYDPLYLSSAALVLAGLTLVSHEVAKGTSVLGPLGVATVAELYAFALIGGAAFLTRMKLRRPAAMLALLAVLYQCDLTLHVETCTYFGHVGRAAAAAWVVLFVVKLYALAAALELRMSRSAILVPSLGAFGLAVLPQLFREIDPAARTSLVALFVFGVGAAGLWTPRTIESAVGFDERGRRAVRATWLMWSALGLGHVLYWIAEHGVHPVGLVPVGALLGARWMRRETSVWAVALGTLAAVGLLAPGLLSSTAGMVAVVLALRALRVRVDPARAQAPLGQPYRGALLFAPEATQIEAVFGRAQPEAMHRLLLGALWSTHLSAWTLGWSGGAFPEHRIVLDVVLVLACALAAWRSRHVLAAVPVAATYLHLAIAVGWIGAPRGALQWGVASIVLGFALLAGALTASWRWRPRESRAPRSPTP